MMNFNNNCGIIERAAKRTGKPVEQITQGLLDYYKWLDSPPPVDRIKKRDDKYPYLPIEIIDAQLRAFYGEYSIENTRTMQIENEFVVTCELVLTHPVTWEKIRLSGIASNPILQNAKTDITKFKEAKIKNALEYGAPSTLSSAITNAASKLGNLFGQNIGRKDVKPDYKTRKLAEFVFPGAVEKKPNEAKK